MFISEYSAINTKQIRSQCKNPTDLDGVRGWERKGLQPRKGEVGIVVWNPVRFNDKDEAIGFSKVVIFDRSQVEPIPGWTKPHVTANHSVKSTKPTSKTCKDISWNDILSGKG
jgi:hypothetical protein